MANNENFDDEDFCIIDGDDDFGYCERCGGRIGNDGKCEICGDDHKWTWLLTKNTDKVKCTNCGTDIHETRRYCFFCGEKNELAFKKGSLYCPKCGNAIENGICPNCGKEKNDILVRSENPEDLRCCSVCGGKTYKDDFFCSNCGNENYINKPIKPSSDKPIKEKQEEIIIPRSIPLDDYHCPQCGGYFDMEGFCWECAVDRIKVSLRKLKLEEAKHCRFCGEIISVEDKFCTYCGKENHIHKPTEVQKSVAEREEKEFPERMEARKKLRSEQLKRYNERNERRREERRRIREEAERRREAEQTEPIRPTVHTATVPEHLKTNQSAGYSGYYFADLHTTLWLVLGIVSLVICCLPTGIGTIICSIGAKRAEDELEYNVAKRKITFAKVWFFAGAAVILMLMVASVIIRVTTN